MSVWPFASIRADTAPINIGEDSNVQDGAVLHVDIGVPITIGSRVTVGHRAILHGATIEDDVLVGMGAIVLNHAIVGAGCVIGAGALCPERMAVPPGSLVLGVPGRVVRATTPAERDRIAQGARGYAELAAEHRETRHARWR